MNKIILAVMLGAVSFAAAAQPASDEMIPVPGRALRIELPAQPLFLDTTQTNEYRGAYSLSNGQTLHLRSYGRLAALFGEIDGEGEHKMVASAPNVFVAKDRALKVTLNLTDDGEASGEVLIAVPSKRLADGSWSQAQIVSAAAVR